MGHTVGALRMPNTTLVQGRPKNIAVWPLSGLGVPRHRRKRHISARDMSALLDYHNHIRASVHPPAANMEYMVSPKLFLCTFPPRQDCSLWPGVPGSEELDHLPGWLAGPSKW